MSQRNPIRERIAREAARIMVEGGIRDFQLAKRKAVERLRLAGGRQLPRNEEIEAAIHEYQRLFRGDSQPQRLIELRRAALEAMRFLERFEPCLVGAVLNGTADEHSEVCLHLFAEPAETVALFLIEHRIPFDFGERRLRVAAEHYRRFPAYRFMADDVPIELVVFDIDARRQAPLSPINGRPMSRAARRRVEALLEEAPEPLLATPGESSVSGE